MEDVSSEGDIRLGTDKAGKLNKHRDPSQGRDGRWKRDRDFVFLFIVGLIGAVVIWGLIRDRIDTTALLALSSLAGAIAGLAGRSGRGKKPGDDEDEQ